MIWHKRSIHWEFKIHGVPLVIVVMLFINIIVDQRLANVHKEEHWNSWEHNSGVVSRNTNVYLSISLESNPRIPPSKARWFFAKSNSLFSEALDILIDVTLYLRFNFVSLNHLNHLLLLFVNWTVMGSDLLKPLIDIVLETFRHFYILTLNKLIIIKHFQ